MKNSGYYNLEAYIKTLKESTANKSYIYYQKQVEDFIELPMEEQMLIFKYIDELIAECGKSNKNFVFKWSVPEDIKPILKEKMEEEKPKEDIKETNSPIDDHKKINSILFKFSIFGVVIWLVIGILIISIVTSSTWGEKTLENVWKTIAIIFGI